MVVSMGFLAVLLGTPLGVAAGRGFARAVADLLNFTIYSDVIPMWVYLVQLVAGLVVPALVALVPIYKATRITPFGKPLMTLERAERRLVPEDWKFYSGKCAVLTGLSSWPCVTRFVAEVGYC